MILRVYAMARPRRPAIEREAVQLAAAPSGSARQRAACVARQVAGYLARDEATEPDDVEAIARRLAVALAPSPIEVLATDPDADAGGLMRAARLARFEARACRQLPADEWAAETSAILRQVEATLARRYARHLS